MRPINRIVVHCSATRAGQDFCAGDIEKWHKQRGWRKIGYHYVIRLDGVIENGRPISEIGAHAFGHNADSIGICYIGGLCANGKACDTRTAAQKEAMRSLIYSLHKQFPGAEVLGHRDLSPDVDGDGVVERWEWTKECPSFDVKEWYYGK